MVLGVPILKHFRVRQLDIFVTEQYSISMLLKQNFLQYHIFFLFYAKSCKAICGTQKTLHAYGTKTRLESGKKYRKNTLNIYILTLDI